MPLYDFFCWGCGWTRELLVKIADRHDVRCPVCDKRMGRKPAAPLGKIAGQTAKGGGPDKFTADALRIPLKDLPPALKADYKP